MKRGENDKSDLSFVICGMSLEFADNHVVVLTKKIKFFSIILRVKNS